MPHLSAEDAEVQSAILRVGASASQNSVEIDAQEDRAIVGYELSIDRLPSNTSVEGLIEAFIGSDPQVPNGETTEDLGSKFYVHRAYRWVADTTNGLGVQKGMDADQTFFEDHTFDWNEDVTITLDHTEDTGNATPHAQLTVYYVEKGSGL